MIKANIGKIAIECSRDCMLLELSLIIKSVISILVNKEGMTQSDATDKVIQCVYDSRMDELGFSKKYSELLREYMQTEPDRAVCMIKEFVEGGMEIDLGEDELDED